MHGHNYAVELELQCEDDELEGPGFVKDYGELREFGSVIQGLMDHQDINETFRRSLAGRTTSENLARALFGVAREVIGRQVVAVRVSETEGTWAEYRPG